MLYPLWTGSSSSPRSLFVLRGKPKGPFQTWAIVGVALRISQRRRDHRLNTTFSRGPPSFPGDRRGLCRCTRWRAKSRETEVPNGGATFPFLGGGGFAGSVIRSKVAHVPFGEVCLFVFVLLGRPETWNGEPLLRPPFCRDLSADERKEPPFVKGLLRKEIPLSSGGCLKLLWLKENTSIIYSRAFVCSCDHVRKCLFADNPRFHASNLGP